jgi:hypothetical protein
VDCTITAYTDNSVTYQVVFKKFPVLPYENNIFTNDGNPPLAVFSCNADQIVSTAQPQSITCTVGELNTDKTYPGALATKMFCPCGVRFILFYSHLRLSSLHSSSSYFSFSLTEYAICSNRGICDFDAGVCHCFEQFVNANCGSYKKAIAVVEERAVSTSEVMVLESSNPDFDKTILKFQTFDIGTEAFNTIVVKNMLRVLFVLDGYGNVRMNYGGLTIGAGTNTLSSGMTINTGGLKVTGGVTAQSNTLVIKGRTVVSGVTIGNGGMSVTGTSKFYASATVAGGFSVTKGLNTSYVSFRCNPQSRCLCVRGAG